MTISVREIRHAVTHSKREPRLYFTIGGQSGLLVVSKETLLSLLKRLPDDQLIHATIKSNYVSVWVDSGNSD